MTKLWLNITHGFQARMLLRSQIAERLLAEGAELVVCSPSAEEPYFREEFAHPQITLVAMPQAQSRLETRLSLIRQYVLMNPALGGTLNHKFEALRRQRPRRWWVGRALNPLFGRIPLLRRAYIATERRLFPGRQYDSLLQQHRPDLVVTGTPGFNDQDTHLLRAAGRHGIPTCTVMLSWDNLTSKGYMNAVPDRLLVWSELMADEAVRYHDFPRDRIDWVGAAQFDHYFGFREQFDRSQWRREQGIPDDALLIVYGTINPAILPHEPRIVEQIAAAVEDDKLGRSAYLWVRLHPQVVRGVFSTSLAPYEALASERVRIETPPVQSESLSWDLPQQDSQHLAQLLCAAEVVATPSSTLAIDAACLDTPIISVQFDGDRPVEAAVSAKRFLKYTHYRQLLDTGGVTVANSLGEFVRHVGRYRSQPADDADGRELIVQQQLGRFDGQAGRRTADCLLKLAGARPHQDGLAPKSPATAEVPST